MTPSARSWRAASRHGARWSSPRAWQAPCRRAARFVRAAPRHTRTRAGLLIEVQSELGRRRAGGAPDRRFQRRQCADRAGGAAGLGGAAGQSGARAGQVPAPRAAAWRCSAAAAARRWRIVDYAHTPDALAKALRAARLHCRGRAARGVRLRRRPRCGQAADDGRIAAELADDIIVTDDNPRSEDPARIVADDRRRHRERRDAARHRARPRAGDPPGAGALAAPDDVVLIAGKGHEDYQIVGHERRAFSDQAVVRRAAGQDRSHEAHAGRIRARLWRAPARGGRELHRRGRPTRARWPRRSCSSRCAAELRRRTTSSAAAAAGRRRRCRGQRRARRCRCRRSWCPTCRRRSSAPRAPGARSSPVRWSASPAATARPPSRR